MNYPFERDGNKIRFPGIQMRNEGPHDWWTIIAENTKDNLITVRLPPGTCWNGQGRPARYVPAEIRVFKLDLKRSTCDILLEIPLSKKSG